MLIVWRPVTGSPKIGDKPMSVASARYSLVKGERIVRFALTTRLMDQRLLQPGFYTARNGVFWQLIWDNIFLRSTQELLEGGGRLW